MALEKGKVRTQRDAFNLVEFNAGNTQNYFIVSERKMFPRSLVKGDKPEYVVRYL